MDAACKSEEIVGRHIDRPLKIRPPCLLIYPSTRRTEHRYQIELNGTKLKTPWCSLTKIYSYLYILKHIIEMYIFIILYHMYE